LTRNFFLNSKCLFYFRINQDEEEGGIITTEQRPNIYSNCPACGKCVPRLKNHLIKVHAYTKLRAQDAVYSQDTYYRHKTSTKPKAARVRCPVEGCGSHVTRLDQHVRRAHDVKLKDLRAHAFGTPIRVGKSHNRSSSSSSSKSSTKDARPVFEYSSDDSVIPTYTPVRPTRKEGFPYFPYVTPQKTGTPSAPVDSGRKIGQISQSPAQQQSKTRPSATVLSSDQQVRHLSVPLRVKPSAAAGSAAQLQTHTPVVPPHGKVYYSSTLFYTRTSSSYLIHSRSSIYKFI